MNIQIRLATFEDAELILSFLASKAEFDGNMLLGYPFKLEATADKLKQTLFCNPPMAQVLFAEVEGIAVGFALFRYTYSSFLAQPCIWLDDIFVRASMRGRGIGAALLAYLAKIAKEKNCGRIEWTVAVNNARGINFYQRHGAQILESIRVCRVTGESISQLALN